MLGTGREESKSRIVKYEKEKSETFPKKYDKEKNCDEKAEEKSFP